jgi:RNA polymerase sigma-70 factor, ECF subfamily
VRHAQARSRRLERWNGGVDRDAGGGLRPLLFALAYRMLGSVADAEDIVQDAFVRYQRALVERPTAIASPKAYLSAVVTRLAIDQLRSARVRRATYAGPWLPEPVRGSLSRC